MVHISSPVTALAHLHTKSATLLLAGEGPLLRVFDDAAHQLVCAEKVFRTQAIHGIRVCENVATDGAENAPSRVLVWGGRSLCCIRLDPERAGPHAPWQIRCHPLLRETLASDWILDSCFISSPSTQHGVSATRLDVLLLTAHNVLLLLNVPGPSTGGSSADPVVTHAAAGPRSILYSGHVVLLSSGQVLIAAGTVFGEVLLWSCTMRKSPSTLKHIHASLLHYTFLGHEGSVFGVRISDGILVPGSNAVRRILASCSDDRTIRVWDVSDVTCGTPGNWQEDAARTSMETGFTASNSQAGQISSNLIAVAMGHLSRIWGVRFLSRLNLVQQLLSYGEDASLQVWEFDLVDPEMQSGMVLKVPPRALRHQNTYSFHAGKHIWSVALLDTKHGPWKVSTGGADGCIASYNILPSKAHEQYVSLWNMTDVWDKCERQCKEPETSTASTFAPSLTSSSTKATFTALEGEWVLKRTIESALPLYPSGAFKGIAVFQRRMPSDQEYDMEYLYVEEGEFTTKQGVSFSGSRRYVYRYQASTDAITAWFVNIDDKISVDYLFHDLDFQQSNIGVTQLEGCETGSSAAKGYHLCGKDDYWVEYNFTFVGATIRKWNLQYNVKGPEKNYVADANYTRLDNVDHLSGPAFESVSDVREAQPAKTAATEFQRPALGPQDSFKSYTWVGDVEFLVTTEKGHVLLGTLQCAPELTVKEDENHHVSQRVSWEQLTQLDGLKSYCIATGVVENGIALMSGTDGAVYLYHHCGRSIGPLTTLPRKISGLFAQALGQTTNAPQQLSPPIRVGMVASCLGSATAHALILEVDSLRTGEPRSSILQTITMTLPSTFIVTSAGFTNSQNLIILGSRSGALALYDVSSFSGNKTGIEFSCCVRHVHGDDAITVIKSVPLTQSVTDISVGYLLTTGRDGRYGIHHWKLESGSQSSKLTLETVHIGAPSFGPNIEGAVFQLSTGDLLLWGFRNKHFVVWNHMKQREVMAIECGGTHRSWAFSPGGKKADSRMSLVWTKASTFHVESRPRTSHEVFQDGGHGREIKAMTISALQDDYTGSCRRLVATGAEDTAIRIFSYKSSDPGTRKYPLQCISTFAKHTTGLQQLRWSKDGRYLFSAAGCGEFYAWRVRLVPLFGIGVVCDAQCPAKSDSADLRVMDFDIVEIGGRDEENENTKQWFLIAMVYSDSSVRVSVATLFQGA